MSEEFEVHGQHGHAVEHAAGADSLGRSLAVSFDQGVSTARSGSPSSSFSSRRNSVRRGATTT